MKTVILVRHAGAKIFGDDEVRAAVALAGDSTLIIDQQRDTLAPLPPPPALDRTNVQALFAQDRDGRDVQVSHDLELNPSNIWLLDLAGLTSRQIGLVLWSLRSRMFDLPELPLAVVLESDAATHVDVFKQLRNEFGPSAKRQRHLKQAEGQVKLQSFALRVFGLKSYKLAKKLLKLRDKASRPYKRNRVS